MLVAVENLSHTYKDRAALREFNLHLNRREILGLVGPNGSGKSTLLRVLSTLVKPQSGRVEICGFDVAKHPAAVRERIGVVFQTATLDKMLTVEENLLTCGVFYGLEGRALHERVRTVLVQFGIADRRAQLAGTLSGGLMRRAEIARALLHQPQLLILDEPSTGLDPAAREDFWKALYLLREESSTAVLLSTHIYEEADLCDSLLLMDEGRRVAEGSPADLKASVGANVIEVRVADLEAAVEELRQSFGFALLVRDGAIYIEVEAAHTLIPRIVEGLSQRVESIGFHQPTLRDVFRKFTSVRAESVVAA